MQSYSLFLEFHVYQIKDLQICFLFFSSLWSIQLVVITSQMTEWNRQYTADDWTFVCVWKNTFTYILLSEAA